jgi:hypothetical protein
MITSSSASVTAYGHPRRRATTRIARSEYPASPAWQNGAESSIDPIRNMSVQFYQKFAEREKPFTAAKPRDLSRGE